MRYAAFVRAVMVGRDGLHREALLDAFDRLWRRGVDVLSFGGVKNGLGIGECLTSMENADIHLFI